MANKIYALDLDNQEWSRLLEEKFEQPRFRADQICEWIWQKRTFDTNDMTNLSKPLREKLESRMDFGAPILIKEERSSIDGTRKYLWQLRDGQTVESIFMKQGDRATACISTQVGCPLGCTFCATGLSGYIRNLSAGEIAGQVLAMEKTADRDINNVVYMGMGEPFLNTEAVLKSVRMLNDPKMRNLGIRHIAISTSGIIPGILELAASGLGVRLAVSLHAAEDSLRSALMPVNETFPLNELRKALQEYQKITGNRITIEYVLLGGVNDSVEHARELLRYLKGIHVFINLIPFNQVDGRYEKPQAENILRFRSVLETAGFESTIREEQGADIDAACGQLRRKTQAGEPCALEPKLNDSPLFDTKKRQSSSPKIDKTKSRRPLASSDSEHGSESRQRTEKSAIRTPDGYVEERGAKKPFSPRTDKVRPRKPLASSDPEQRSETNQRTEKSPTKTSGGYVDERGGRKPFSKKTDQSRPRRPLTTPDAEQGSETRQRTDKSPTRTSGRYTEERGEKRPFASKTDKSRPRRPLTTPDAGQGSETRQRTEKSPTRTSGRYTEERGEKKTFSSSKRRKTDAPIKERYKSGKMKEERPTLTSGKSDWSGDPVSSQGKGTETKKKRYETEFPTEVKRRTKPASATKKKKTGPSTKSKGQKRS